MKKQTIQRFADWLFSAGRLHAKCFGKKIKAKVRLGKSFFYSGYISRGFRQFGKNSHFSGDNQLGGKEFISIGDNCRFCKGVRLFATNSISGNDSILEIGNCCTIGQYSYITAVNHIKIGENLLTGAYVLITDNSHGSSNWEDMQLPPAKRRLSSKGSVTIGNNVWIGDKATILPNVSIGDGCIIGANSVVTKDIPSYCVAAGNPAIIIKQLNNE